MFVDAPAALLNLALPLLLSSGRSAAAGFLVVGRRRRSDVALGLGEVLLGAMLLATVEVLYLSDANRFGGALVLGVDDLLALGLLGVASGFVVSLGLNTVWARSPPPKVLAIPRATLPAKR